jgi:lanosterol synthase
MMTTTRSRKRGAESDGTNGAHDLEKGAAPKRQKLGKRTDYTRWRLKDNNSDHTWIYLEDDETSKAWPQTTAEKWYLGLDVVQCSPHFRSSNFRRADRCHH